MFLLLETVAKEQLGLMFVCSCLMMLVVGKLRLGISSATPISGKPSVGTCQCLICLLFWWGWGWDEWAALFRFQDSLKMSQPAPTQTDCYLGNSGLGFPLLYLSAGSSAAPILLSTHRSFEGPEVASRLDEIVSLKDSHFGLSCTLSGPICSVRMRWPVQHSHFVKANL